MTADGAQGTDRASATPAKTPEAGGFPDPLRDLLARFRGGEPLADEATGRLLLRVGLAAVFLWFGVDKFLNPGYWAMWVPEALAPVFATDAGLYALGLVEVVLGAGLLWEHRWLREVALLTAGYLALVVVGQGVAPVVRDLGLLAAALYLGLTTPGAAAEEPEPSTGSTDTARDASTSPPRTVKAGTSQGPPSTRLSLGPGRKVLAALAIVAGLLLGAALAAGLPGWTASRSAGSGPPGAMLTFAEPADGTEVATGAVPVRVQLSDDVHDLGVNHVHIKLDGKVVDALYFGLEDDAVETTVQVRNAGEHTLTAYLAYSDHTELAGSETAIQITAT